MAYRKLTWVHDNYPSIGCNNSLGKEEKMVLNYKKLGKKIKEFRLTNGLSQEQLAEACNLSTSYISYIETGKKKINFSKLEKIARILTGQALLGIKRANWLRRNDGVLFLHYSRQWPMGFNRIQVLQRC